MDNVNEIIKSLSNSPYLSEWIIKLQNNKRLFSVDTNIRPCEVVSENTYRSAFWNGLYLLQAYCDRGLEDANVDSFIIGLLNECINKYRNDIETDPFKKLNSSNAILRVLFEISISKTIFINSIDFVFLVKTYFEGALTWPFHIVYDLYKKQEKLVLADGNKLFEVYKFIIENSKESNDYNKYLNISLFISKNPTPYFEYSKDYVLSYSKKIYDMSSFAEYDDRYVSNIDCIIFQWLKFSSSFIEKTALKKDLTDFIKSEKELENKAGLCLLGINFQRLKKLFYDNIQMFFNNQYYYADLLHIFKTNKDWSMTEDERKNIVENISKAKFGLTDEKRIIVLRNHLAGVCREIGFDVPYFEEKQNEIEYAENFNKSFYIVSRDTDSDFKNISSKICSMTMNEAADYYKTISKTSFYYEDLISKAYTQLFISKYQKSFIDKIGMFDVKLYISVLHHLLDDDKIDMNLIYDLLLAIIEQLKQPVNSGHLSSVLYGIKKLIDDDFELFKCYTLLNKIDPSWLVINEYNNENAIITTCINENAHLFYEMYSYIVEATNSNKDILIKSIETTISLYDCNKLKSILAFLFPRLININSSYALSKVDYIFDNSPSGNNLSYPLLSVSSGGSRKEVLDILCKRADFNDFLCKQYEDNDFRRGQNVIYGWLFRAFIRNNSFKVFVLSMISSKKFNALLECVRAFNYWVENKMLKKENIERFNDVMVFFSNNLNLTDIDFEKNEFFFYELSKTIVLLEQPSNSLWDLLFLFFKKYNHFIPDSCLELISKYKNKDFNHILQFLNIYFDNLNPLYISQSTMQDIFNLINKEPKYKKYIKEWKVKVFKINDNIVLN